MPISTARTGAPPVASLGEGCVSTPEEGVNVVGLTSICRLIRVSDQS
jgi:hypothetical protein